MDEHKHLIIASLSAIVICGISLFAMIPLSTTASTNRGSDWMKDIDNETSITSLSIPGSHDSGALHSIADLAGKCQDLSISDQLKAGARFFDIRLQQRNNELKIVHGIVDQSLSFANTLNDFDTFLLKHPNEMLIVSIKEESTAKNSDQSFDEALKKALDNHSSWNTSGNLPTSLGKARGQIFLISRYKDSSIGLKAYDGWLDPDSSSITNTFDISESNLHVQDYYKVSNINNKQDEITNCFEYSKNNVNTLTLNFSSCYFVNAFPPAYAGTSAKIINNWLIDEIKERENLGIIISDFVTSSLCEAIYKRNMK